MWLSRKERQKADPSGRVCIAPEGEQAAEQYFGASFRIGRGVDCEVQVGSGLASRTHAEVVYDEGCWWVRDLDSTNGTYLDDEQIQRARLIGRARLQIGLRGPAFQLAVISSEPGRPVAEAEAGTEKTGPRRAGGGASEESSRPSSLAHYVRRYFKGEDGGAAGQHTRMIRQAYAAVKQKQKQRQRWVIAAVLVLCLGVGVYALRQDWENRRLRQMAETLFYQMKAQDLAIAQLRGYVQKTEGADLAEQLAQMRERRRTQARQYAGYVHELGLRRQLDAEEQLIYRVARIFNESEFSMPAGFVRAVREEIRSYWLTPAGRERFARAIRRAEENSYTPYIVRTMREHGLPPEVFYLVLQESNFNTRAVGPHTRWGIAKGMWQFIPSTARLYGLRVGPRAGERVVDPQDERHDFGASTRAAARYLQTIYNTLAQASGLLVLASYNWGEHRVKGKLERLPGPQAIPEEALEGIPENPRARNYWRFLTEYEDRMPEETKDYVLKIFAAAVIGQDPRLFGFDFDNPLREYIEAPPLRMTAVE